MKKYFAGFFYSLPVQLVFLHFRRYQVLLLFWAILFATISGHFLKPYGADTLMLAPEYLGKVSALSTSFVGFCYWFLYYELEYNYVYPAQPAY